LEGRVAKFRSDRGEERERERERERVEWKILVYQIANQLRIILTGWTYI
jgi:hypothetical protein